MLFWGGGHKPHGSDFQTTAIESSNYQIPALERMEFFVQLQSTMTPTTEYADIILPARDWMWEEKNVVNGGGGYGGFQAINYCAGVLPPAGEVRSFVWVFTKLAEKLGIDPKAYFKYYTTDENWDADWERYQQDNYGLVVDYYKKLNIEVPSWEEFSHGKFINCDELDNVPFTGFDEQMKKGNPFKTKSGKIEFYSNYMADEANRGRAAHLDHTGRLMDNLAGDWGPVTPHAVYRKTVKGMDDPRTQEYPLMVLAPHARYRVHYLFWEQPWLRNHVYRHRVWMNPKDAMDRGIKDGDMVLVHNERGKLVMPAYVTGRLMPGLIVLRHGGK
jgi:anaerobic dimethyl sulfoxide reductase subunit A